MRSNAPLVVALALCLVASGCGGGGMKQPSAAERRAVAQRFAEAVFHGDARRAVALLAHPDDAGLSLSVTRAAAPWKARHGAVRLPGARLGEGWVFGYYGTHTHRDGRFERVHGDLVVVVAASRGGAGVRFFTFRHEAVRFSTHHDALLLPSNR